MSTSPEVQSYNEKSRSMAHFSLISMWWRGEVQEGGGGEERRDVDK